MDPHIAHRLGFPRPQYMAIERERRWLCRQLPRERIVSTDAITDLYVTGSRLRLREARPLDGGAPRLRLTRKADVDVHTRLITSIYLPETEFAMLAVALSGNRIRKLRHRLEEIDGVVISVDEFQGDLAGLLLAEAEFKNPEHLDQFAAPEFVAREVTDDPRYTGAHLAEHGMPPFEDAPGFHWAR
ncbi:MAG: hypothetical protein RSP_16710 [Rhodanobacter sp.]